MRGSAPVLTALLLPAALGPGSAPRRAAAVPVRRRHGSAPPRCMQMRCKSLPGKRAGERRYATTPSAPCMQTRSTPAAARAARSGNTAIGRGPAANETARKKISREPAGAGPGRKQRRAGGGGRGRRGRRPREGCCGCAARPGAAPSRCPASRHTPVSATCRPPWPPSPASPPLPSGCCSASLRGASTSATASGGWASWASTRVRPAGRQRLRFMISAAPRAAVSLIKRGCDPARRARGVGAERRVRLRGPRPGGAREPQGCGTRGSGGDGSVVGRELSVPFRR